MSKLDFRKNLSRLVQNEGEINAEILNHIELLRLLPSFFIPTQNNNQEVESAQNIKETNKNIEKGSVNSTKFKRTRAVGVRWKWTGKMCNCLISCLLEIKSKDGY